jgi:signal transduction histidine kinase
LNGSNGSNGLFTTRVTKRTSAPEAQVYSDPASEGLRALGETHEVSRAQAYVATGSDISSDISKEDKRSRSDNRRDGSPSDKSSDERGDKRGVRQGDRRAESDIESLDDLLALILAPVGRDAELIESMLRAANIRAERIPTAEVLVQDVAAEITAGAGSEVGVIIATDDALGIDWSLRLADVLDRQPSWSDLPMVLLARSPSEAGDRRWVGSTNAGAVSERLMLRGSVTVLDRPVRVATLVSAVRAALRARARQLEVFGLIEATTKAQEAAERAARAKSDFLAQMSHELRTPLNAIAGYADLLLTGCYGPVPPEQQRILGRITTAQKHLLGLINDILNYAKLEKGRVEFDIEPVRLRDVIAEVGPLIEPLLTAKGLGYDVVLPPSSLFVLADRDKLRQILLNLLSNAMKFTPPQGRIRVAVAERADGSQPTQRVFLRVSDTGCGIPDDKLDAVFEPFVQVRADHTAKREGTGLGLAISRDLARGMEGDLRVRSEVGRGSVFTVELRRAPGA